VRIRQQVQRVRGQLRLYPVKTAAGRRDLPLLPVVRDMLRLRADAQAADREELGRAWEDNGLVFTTRTGRPIEPRNLLRSFRRICDHNDLRLIKVHHLRHTTVTLLKNLGVPARDAQRLTRRAARLRACYRWSDGDVGRPRSEVTDAPRILPFRRCGRRSGGGSRRRCWR